MCVRPHWMGRASPRSTFLTPPRERVVSIAAKFEIEYLQYLDAEGKQVRDDLPEFTKDLDHMVELYKLMMSTRVFDAKSVALQRTGKLGTYAKIGRASCRERV